MKRREPFPTNLELRETNPDGSEGAGLSHTPGGMFLFHVLELAADGEPRGGVTIVHDAGDHGARYEELAQALAPDGWAISLPDLRGHGDSEGARGHAFGFAEVARDLVAVQDHLCFMFPESPKVLVGTGLGALYALAFALDKPERAAALVLINPLLEPRFRLPEPKGGLLGLFKKTGPTTPGQIGHTPEQLTRDPAERARIAADKFRHDVVTLQAGRAAQELAAGLPARVSELGCPVLLLLGGADSIAAPALAERVLGARAEVKRYDGMLHDLLHDVGWEQVVADIRAWLARVLPR
jgi:alpha-beta hydrolase superfamily lysophospholipase